MNIKHLSGRTILQTAALASVLTACISCNRHMEHFSDSEKALINGADSIMRVLTTENADDLAVLRSKSTDLSAASLVSEDYARLAELMTATVTHPSQDGVGIAAPQVGLNRRIVAVQRFDKVGEPFEVYANVQIVWASDSLTLGSEGCLSVPEMRGEVLRSTSIIIEYADLNTLKANLSTDEIPVVRDTINGFTAVIFQHEIDHLEGILYTDRLQTDI